MKLWAVHPTTVLKSSQQYAERISAVQKASRRMRCVVNTGRAAHAAQLAAQRTYVPDKALSVLPMLNRPTRSTELLNTLIDTIGSIEQSAQSDFMFSDNAESPEQAINQAISDALALGEDQAAQEFLLRSQFSFLVPTVLPALRQSSRSNESLIKLAACASI